MTDFNGFKSQVNTHYVTKQEFENLKFSGDKKASQDSVMLTRLTAMQDKFTKQLDELISLKDKVEKQSIQFAAFNQS